MWRRSLKAPGTTTLYLGLFLSHLVGEGGAVTVICQAGQRITLLCTYQYEDHARVSQLAVQWRSPRNELLCHYIKHKAFQNCTLGYTIAYSPGNITLTIQEVKMEDFGTHVCSVSKRHEFSDATIELVLMSESTTSAPSSGWNHSGPTWILVLHALLSCSGV